MPDFEDLGNKETCWEFPAQQWNYRISNESIRAFAFIAQVLIALYS